MKILILTHTTALDSGWGRQTSSILEEYAKKGIDFKVLSEASGTLLPPRSFISFLKTVFSVRKQARGYDIVHAFDGWPYAIYGYFAVLGTNKKLFVNGVGTYSVAAFRSRFKGFLLRRAYLKAKAILCGSAYTRDRILASVPKVWAIVVHLGTTPLPYLSPQEIQQYGPTDRHPVILSVGAIKHRKGQLDTLKAVAILKKDFPHILYTIVGDPGDEAYVQAIKNYARAEDMENALRIVSNADDDRSLAFFYQTCDVFALNSNNEHEHFEGFGLVFLEANQYGKPAVGSRGSGIEDAIRNGVTGYLTEQGNPADIAEKIKLILSKGPDYWKQPTEAFAKSFSWKKTAEHYLAAYSR